MIRKAYACLAVIFLILGIIGVFLPIMPTTPFVLVAAWAAAKGSPRLHAWLYNHHHLGSVLKAWDTRGAIPKNAKWLACVTMTTSWLFMLFLGIKWVFLGIIAALFIMILIFVFTRPNA